jgi:hypothetical protein
MGILWFFLRKGEIIGGLEEKVPEYLMFSVA